MEQEKKLPEKKSVFLLIILTIITFGIYQVVWYLKRSNELNNLNTPKKLSRRIAISYLIGLGLLDVLVTISILTTDPNAPLGNLSTSEWAITIAGTVILIYLVIVSFFLAFRSRTIINQALERKGVTRKVSGLFTFFFHVFYLQYEINRTLENTEYKPRVGPWICLIFTLVLPFLALGIIWAIVNAFIQDTTSAIQLSK